MPKFTLAVDSSQISCFLECPQKWVNQYLKRLVPIRYQQDESLNMGSYAHKLLEIYYQCKARGVGLNDTMLLMDAYNPDNNQCECGCAKEYHTEIPTLGIVECSRCSMIKRGCSNFRPKSLELPDKVRKKVRKRIVDYVGYYQRDDIQPLSEKHVEVGFSETIYEDQDNLFVLEGRIDLIGKVQGLDCFMDHKIQGKTYYLYDKNIQMKNYMLITKLPMGLINYIRLTDKVEKDITLQRHIVNMNRVELGIWHKRLIQVFYRMKKTVQAFSNKQESERNWNACSGGKLTYDLTKPSWCWYTSLCESTDPEIASREESRLFKINENPWRPW